jgi:hypothetical protein
VRRKSEVIRGLLTVFLRAVETALRQRSPGASTGAHFGAAAFVHRFGGDLNSHIPRHELMTNGVFSAGEGGDVVFYPTLDLGASDIGAVQVKMRPRG